MSTVTGLTAARMIAIEGSSVVSGAIDGSGHLILTKHDGTTIDAGYALVAVPDASTTQKGVVELATSSETAALTDGTRAVTPSGLSVVYNTLSTVDGGLNTRIGTLETMVINNHLSSSSFNQATSISAYPMGVSYLYLSDTESSAGGWEFGGSWGLLTIYKYSTDMIVQTWTKHQGGQPSTGTNTTTDLWQRTSNSTGGWSTWVRFKKAISDTLTSATSPVAGQWYRVATIPGSPAQPKAAAEFVISSNGVDHHLFLRLRASVAYSVPRPHLSVEECSGYHGVGVIPMFTKARLVTINSGDIQQGCALEIYCAVTVNTPKVRVQVNHENWMGNDPNTATRWGNLGLTGVPTTPTSPNGVLYTRGIGWTGDWVAPTFTNSWTNFGAQYAPAGYKMTPGGIVRLQGLVKSGTIDISGNSPIFTLPEGCRPGYETICNVISNGSIGRLDIFADGRVSGLQGSNTWISLENISFLAVQ